ncbi:MAG: fibronectin type III-like domain-contianing protein, partial [Thermofilaceae archaeon]|nr:fibronectin type III-like domain-contianing protein [Thermofilaceae archaeon]MCX8181471.1 fibronectin type III-like domain-contianing protein [Thermofilaceae archaeon]
TFNVEPAYEFGYGLSYTTFEYRNLNVKQEGDRIRVCFEIANTGRYPGKEVAQVYVRAPKGKIDKPFQELKAFRKTKKLSPGEVEKIELVVDVRDLASFDESSGYWVVEKGGYQIKVGSSSRDIRLVKDFIIGEELRFKP